MWSTNTASQTFGHSLSFSSIQFKSTCFSLFVPQLQVLQCSTSSARRPTQHSHAQNRKPLKRVLNSSRREVRPLCTQAIVFVRWQTPNQTMSHAKHSLNCPPAANMGWERSELVEDTDCKTSTAVTCLTRKEGRKKDVLIAFQPGSDQVNVRSRCGWSRSFRMKLLLRWSSAGVCPPVSFLPVSVWVIQSRKTLWHLAAL